MSEVITPSPLKTNRDKYESPVKKYRYIDEKQYESENVPPSHIPAYKTTVIEK